MNANLNNDLLNKKNESVDNIRIHDFAKREILTNKSESPESFRHNNNYFPNFNLINNNFNHSNSIIYNNHFNLNNFNNNNNNIHLNKNINFHPNNINNINIINNNNFFNNMNNFNNLNNDINFHLNNSVHNSNQNLNLSYNFSPNINNSFDLNIINKKRGDSFNSCPSLKGNHLSFKSTDDSSNNKQNKNIGNYVNTNLNNFSMNQKPFNLNNHVNNFDNNYNAQYQNYLSMQNLFLNLNPYTASLMRNDSPNKPQHNSAKNLIYFNKNTGFNNKPMSLFNKNTNSPKKLHYNHSYHDINNINNINNSFDAKIYNDNLSNSNLGSSHSIKKKRTSLFQNECNKEKDLRDFKRFCDGLKMPMCEYICNQIGSRIMQKYLKKFPSHIRTLLINKISPYIDKLMCNTYGNYFCQKLYNISDLQQRIVILNSLKNSFCNISKNNCGAHAAQFIIGAAQSQQEKKMIVECLQSNELDLSYNTEGTHVIQKILSCFIEDERLELNNVLSDKNNLSTLCQDAKGICVIKKLILGTKDINNKIKIVDGVYNNCVEIALSPYGNYIIQIIFEEWDVDICLKLIEACIENAFILSCQKYSSNIIVKIMELYLNGEKKENKYNLGKKLKDIFFDEKNISDLYNNKYGRLLLNKIGKFVTSEEKENLEKKFKDQKNDLDILKDIFC